MLTKDFYKIIDSEISEIINEYKNNAYLKKLDENGKKSYGLLLWFLKRYHPTGLNYEDYITEGEDDSSCDIIFNNKNNFGEEVYYVVQSKWFSESNIGNTNNISKEIRACLSDFELILDFKKKPSKINLRFNQKYSDLKKHYRNNKEIKFIFLALCIGTERADDNINNFNRDLVRCELFDILKLKRNYIELTYKGVRTHNPIETPYEPKDCIDIKVIPSTYIRIRSPYESYIFLIKPKLLYDLFKKYGYALFYKNIRNPLRVSSFNEKIIETLKDNPLNFWYFNNGITAITDSINRFHDNSDTIQINGLQIINGAQTVYSIFEAFEGSRSSLKEKINHDSLITLRILKSGGKDFDLNVTRYTNSQNPVNDRDFYSNDEFQTKLQNEFFDYTNIWYERRRGEFISNAKNVEKISNEEFAQAYLSYYLQEPVKAKSERQYFFTAEKEKNGLYERIFNNKTRYEYLQLSYYLFRYVNEKRRETDVKLKSIVPRHDNKYKREEIETLKLQFVPHATFHILALLKIVLEYHFNTKEITGRVISANKNDDFSFFDKYYKFIIKHLKKSVIVERNNPTFSYTKFFKSAESYIKLKDVIEDELYN